MKNPHECQLSEKAERQLRDRVPDGLRYDVLKGIEQFANDPYADYRRAIPPAEFPGYLIHDLGPFEAGGTEYRFKLFFHFGQDERSVMIKAIGVVPYSKPL